MVFNGRVAGWLVRPPFSAPAMLVLSGLRLYDANLPTGQLRSTVILTTKSLKSLSEAEVYRIESLILENHPLLATVFP